MADADIHRGMEGLKLDDNYLIAAAIDFGTTFSGYAFSFKTTPQNIVMNKNWGSSTGVTSLKAPTSLLTNPDGSFNSFGFEAEDEYLQCEPEDGHELYRGFKMVLHTENLSMDAKIKSTSGYETNAMGIFAMSLEFLKDHMMKTIGKVIKDSVKSEDIRWVLTVPAIWTDEAKQFMRTAAYEGGLITEPDSGALLIALEPEAASFYCRSIDIKAFGGSDSEPDDAKFKAGDKMMIIDAGGGTVDITAHELLINGEVKEIAPPSGGPWGGLGVNRKFIAALSKIFGQDFINHMKAKSPQQWISFASAFESAKKNIKADGSTKLRLQLPFLFHQEFLALKGKELEHAIKEHQDKEVSCSSGVLVMSADLVKSFFEDTCTNTVKHVKKLLRKPAFKGLQYILLVGGYGDSPMLQDACTSAFGRKCKVLFPLGPQTAIVQGAVMFGHQPSVISVRIAKDTYGCQADLLFDEKIHEAGRKYASKRDGQIRCRGTFREFVKIGEEIKNPEVKLFTVHPVSKKEKRMTIKILRSQKENVLYCDEERVSDVGKIKLKSPTGYFGDDIEIKVTFGHTEILVEARDTSKGKDFLVKASLDFST